MEFLGPDALFYGSGRVKYKRKAHLGLRHARRMGCMTRIQDIGAVDRTLELASLPCVWVQGSVLVFQTRILLPCLVLHLVVFRELLFHCFLMIPRARIETPAIYF